MWCTMVEAVLTSRLTGSGFDLAWFSSHSCGVPLYLRSLWCYMYFKKFVTFFTLPFGKLSLVELALDLID